MDTEGCDGHCRLPVATGKAEVRTIATAGLCVGCVVCVVCVVRVYAWCAWAWCVVDVVCAVGGLLSSQGEREGSKQQCTAARTMEEERGKRQVREWLQAVAVGSVRDGLAYERPVRMTLLRAQRPLQRLVVGASS